jgi:hypothetical protein
MDEIDIATRLGRIEGQLGEILKVCERVRVLEIWVGWIRGGWAVMVAAYCYLCRVAWAR